MILLCQKPEHIAFIQQLPIPMLKFPVGIHSQGTQRPLATQRSGTKYVLITDRLVVTHQEAVGSIIPLEFGQMRLTLHRPIQPRN